MVGTEGPAGIAWTATVSTNDGAPWLAATPARGIAPARLVIEADVAGLAAGTYPATVTIAERGSTAPTLSIPVELVVVPASGADAPATRSP